MAREISAGGVVLRQISGVWHVALIEPQKNEPQKNEAQKNAPPEEAARRQERRASAPAPY